MATHKLDEFVRILQFAASTDTGASVGLAPPLCKLLLDILTAHELKRDIHAVIDNIEALEPKLRETIDTDTCQPLLVSPLLSVYLLDQLAAARSQLPARVREVTEQLDTANALVADLHEELAHVRKQAEESGIKANDAENKVTNLQSAVDFIEERLPALNPARGTDPVADKAIDDISLAIDTGADPTVILAERVDAVDVAVAPAEPVAE